MTMTLEIQNGKWSLNDKPISICSKEKKELFSTHLRMKKFKMPVQEKRSNTLKSRAEEIKSKYNYKFNPPCPY